MDLISYKEGSKKDDMPIFFTTAMAKMKTKKLDPFYKSFVQQESYKFPHYYRIYFNTLFCLLLSPFWVASTDGNPMQLKFFKIQKIFCFLLNLLILIFTAVFVNASFTSKVKDKPEIIFTICNYLTWASYVIMFSKTVWFKQRQFSKLFDIPTKTIDYKVAITGLILPFICFIYTLNNYVFFEIYDDKLELTPFWDTYYKRVADGFYLKKNAASFSESTMSEKALVGIWLISEIYFNFILVSTEVFVLISSLALYEIIFSVISGFQNYNPSVQVMLTQYIVMKKRIGSINNVNGTLLLCVMFQITSFLSGTTVDAIDEQAIKHKINFVQFCALYFVTFYFCAEANFKTHFLEKQIYQKQIKHMNETNNFDDYQLKVVEMTLNSTKGPAGLTGGRFLVISYPLLGVFASLVGTYAIVMIQFKAVPTTQCVW